MRLHVGTSGFAYKEWVGAFYPEGTRDKDMLAWYATRFDTVEINNTFYRFPTTAGLAAWAAQVPEHFRFAIKAPQRITHIKRLHGVDDDVDHLFDSVTTLGSRLGALLFLLPPRMRLDVVVLRDLVTRFPPGLRVAFEFRDKAWHCKEVYKVLEENGCALCWNDAVTPAPHATADWSYIRLRRDAYEESDLRASAEQILSQPWNETFVFIKHEAPDSPLLARRWAELAQTVGQ